VTRDLSQRRQVEEAMRAEVVERMSAQEQLRELNTSLEAQVLARTADLMRANAELVDAKQRLEDLSSRLIEAQELERGHIARELHDETGQLLTLLRMQLADMAKADCGEGVEACMGLVGKVIEHTRRLARNLRPTMLDDLGLHEALEWMLQQQAGLAGWSATYHGSDAGERFPANIETACFRIAQEALTNAARYARATEVSVSLTASGNTLLLLIKDNGCGFDVQRALSPAERREHFGLVSMSERAKLVGARLAIESSPGHGTRIRGEFPLAVPSS
jgi:signal transduction histidine kinase